jgi:aminobenzoyl-glutamate transport protein
MRPTWSAAQPPGGALPLPLEYVLFLLRGADRVAEQRDPAGQDRPEEVAEDVPSRITRFLRVVEWLGNALPHPVTLFALFALSVVLFSGLMGALGVAVPDPRPVGADGRAADGMIRVVSLMNADGVRRIVQNLVTNFTSFVPLGTVLVAMLGVGVAERSGLLTAMVRAMVLRASPRMVTVAIVFAGVLSNTASEMGYVVLVPLAAMVYYSLGRHPLAGLAAAFAGVSGGYSANLLVGTVDPLLAGITQEAARLIAPGYLVDATANWFFMVGSTFLVVAVVSWISLRIVEPALGPYDRSQARLVEDDEHRMDLLSETERRGLRYAGIAALVMVGLIALLVVPEGAVLRNPDTGAIKDSPFLRGFVALIFVFFLAPGITYGAVVGTMRSDRDVINAMASAMSTLGLYMVLVFFAAQFVAFFGWTNLGAVTAVTGRRAPEVHRADRAAGVRLFHPDVRLREPDARLGLGPVGGHGADLRAHADAARLQPGDCPGRLPHRRFHHQHHHADDELLRPDHGLRGALCPEGGHRHADLDDAALLGGAHRLLDGFLFPLGVRARAACRAGYAYVLFAIKQTRRLDGGHGGRWPAQLYDS